MGELPILFNTEMVRAILDDRKTCTRRVIKDVVKENQEINKNGKGEFELYDITSRCGIPKGKIYNPPYQPGDILYVRETWTDHYVPNEIGKPELQYCYKADGVDIKAECLPGENNRWYPSIHMPKEAARIWLKVTDVRVERLQEITDKECIKEGIYPSNCRNCNATFGCDVCPDEGYDEVDEFVEVWDSTIKKFDLDRYGWDANPYVWVIEFERCEQPGKEQLWRD